MITKRRAPAWMLLALLSGACGGSSSNAPDMAANVAPEPEAPAPEIVALWSRPGAADLVWDAGIGERTVFVNLGWRLESGRFEERLYAIDRETLRERALTTEGDLRLLRVDPLIVNHWDGQRQRWLGTYVVRLDDQLEPRWQSGRMNFGDPRHRAGPLVLIEQSQSGEHVGLDPDEGAVTFRLRGDPDGIMSGAVEAETFAIVPESERAILVDLATGDVSGVVDAELGAWEVVGDRLVTTVDDGLAAYDGHGQRVWSRPGIVIAGRGRRSSSPDEPLVRPSRLYGWQAGRGLVALDANGEELWARELSEADRGYVFAQASQVSVVAGERLTLLLDADDGDVIHDCRAEECDFARVVGDGVLVGRADEEGAFVLTLHGPRGEARWTHSVEAARDHEGRVREPSVAIVGEHVALCRPGGPVAFLDASEGHVVATHELSQPRPAGWADTEPEGRAPRCSLTAHDGLLLASDGDGVTLFGPPASAPATDPPEPIASTLTTMPAPEPRAFYVLSALVPPAEGGHPEGYTRGRALYQRGREAFEDERFADAASSLLEAYRAFRGAENGMIQQLGLESCYDVRVVLDHAEESLRETVMNELGDDDARCRGIIERAPEPSVPF